MESRSSHAGTSFSFPPFRKSIPSAYDVVRPAVPCLKGRCSSEVACQGNEVSIVVGPDYARLRPEALAEGIEPSQIRRCVKKWQGVPASGVKENKSAVAVGCELETRVRQFVFESETW